MNTRQKLSYIAVGAALMLIGMLASSIFMPNLVAQRDKFGVIECTELRVVNNNEEIVVSLSAGEHGGDVGIYGSLDGRVSSPGKILLEVREDGGNVHVGGDDWEFGAVSLGTDEHGGRVEVYSNAGDDGLARAVLGFKKQGGALSWEKENAH